MFVRFGRRGNLVYPAAMRLGQLDSDAARSENASSAAAAHIPGQKVEVPIKVCLGTKLGPLFGVDTRDLIENTRRLESDRR